MRRKALLAALATAALALAVLAYYVLQPRFPRAKARVVVNTDRALHFKDLRGANDGPLSPRGWDIALTLNLSSSYAQLGLRALRFHDLWRVDELDTIFPDPRADPEDPRSYNFAGLDRCVAEAIKHADLLILRIGYDWNDPPKNKPHLDSGKLAEVVKHMVLHYTKGWGGGFHLPAGSLWIEVWNEPDTQQFWGLSAEEYFELYDTVARAVKDANPDVKVGGPAIAFNLTFLGNFLDHVRKSGAPLDFVSWHVYATEPSAVVERARQVKRLMEKYGFGNLPSVLTEWNYWWDREPWDFFRSQRVAAFQAATLIELEDAPVDVATLYRGDAWNWGGIFYRDGAPGKPFYVWIAYRCLVEEAIRLEASVVRLEPGAARGLRVLAGLEGDRVLRLLIVNYADEEVAYEMEVEGYAVKRVLVLDDKNDLREVDACEEGICVIGPYAVQLVELTKR